MYGRLPLELTENSAKNRCPATCITAIVTPNRSLFGILVGTSLMCTPLGYDVTLPLLPSPPLPVVNGYPLESLSGKPRQL